MKLERLLSCLHQRVPIHEFLVPSNVDNDQSGELYSISSQEKILQLIQSIVTHNSYYAKLFLKKYIDIIERQGIEILEELYELYCDETILNAKELGPTESDTLCYTIANHVEVYIKEYPKLISGKGTTGLRTWEAALYMAHFLYEKNEFAVDGATSILELGTGTGLLSLSLANNPNFTFRKLILTDGDSQLIDNLNDTFELNKIEKSNSKISCQQLLWGTTGPSTSEDFIQPVPSSIDYIIAADVTYDSRILSLLCSTINDFFVSGTKAALIAATVRNEETLKDWEIELTNWFGASNWCIKDKCEEPEKLNTSTWFRKGTAEIRIYEIMNAK
ncbi:protein-lysine N-methyltransferase Efm3p [[Candida] railenensis]|uniref:Protein-lysine N-methyltransferase Efm3p n=1 Tax=[Candida] railenensis TaxID=45579 RepID=A0A9P0QLS7_9ASCO|nr:protein-lysine N-methyltransferase Efm3p [[Candida] railenensis]